MRECILEPGRPCMECGRCNMCDLDPEKICDNCCKCLDTADYKEVKIDKIEIDEKIRIKRKKKH